MKLLYENKLTISYKNEHFILACDYAQLYE